VHDVLRGSPGIMVDVGDHQGWTLKLFAIDGWQVMPSSLTQRTVRSLLRPWIGIQCRNRDKCHFFDRR
jgi:hypothetical protein